MMKVCLFVTEATAISVKMGAIFEARSIPYIMVKVLSMPVAVVAVDGYAVAVPNEVAAQDGS